MTKDEYIDHEVRIRMQEICYKNLNKKLDIIMGVCGSIFVVVLVPIVLHAMRLV